MKKIIGLFLLLSGCSPLPINLPGQGFLPFADGFESPPGDRWHFEVVDPSFSVQRVTSPTPASGAYALGVTVRPGDKTNNGIRSEAALYHVAPFGKTVTYRFQVYVPSSYAESELWQILAQWHDQPDFLAGETWDYYQPLSPPVSISLKNTQLILGMNTPGNKNVTVAERAITKDAWHQVELKIHWSDGTDGWVEGTLDGSPWTSTRYYRPNLYNRSGNYFKIGIYRSPDIQSTNTVYFDQVEVLE